MAHVEESVNNENNYCNFIITLLPREKREAFKKVNIVLPRLILVKQRTCLWAYFIVSLFVTASLEGLNMNADAAFLECDACETKLDYTKTH